MPKRAKPSPPAEVPVAAANATTEDLKNAQTKLDEINYAFQKAKEEYNIIFTSFAETHKKAIEEKIKSVLGEEAVFIVQLSSTSGLYFSVTWWGDKPLSREVKSQLTGWAEDYTIEQSLPLRLDIEFEDL